MPEDKDILSPTASPPVVRPRTVPHFLVKALKSYKPEKNSNDLLSFKRKQYIVVKDFDDKTDAIYGELEGKMGWFPSNCVKLVGPIDFSRPETLPPWMVASSEETGSIKKKNSLGPDTEKKRSHSEATIIKQSTETLFKPALGIVLEASLSIIPTSIKDKKQQPITHLPLLKNIKLIDNYGVPLILVHVADFIRNLPNVSDIFKIVGTESEVQTIRDQYEKSDQAPDITRFSEQSVVASLKSFLLNLYDPLVPLDLYLSFTAASVIDDKERRIAQFTYLLELIPLQNFNTLLFVCKFLVECISKSNGKLNSENITRIFAQSFCRKNNLCSINENERKKSQQVAQIFIDEAATLFVDYLNIVDKKADKSRDNLRRKEKETMVSHSRRKKLEEKKREKERRKLSTSDTLLDSAIDFAPTPTETPDNSPKSSGGFLLKPPEHRRTGSVNSLGSSWETQEFLAKQQKLKETLAAVVAASNNGITHNNSSPTTIAVPGNGENKRDVINGSVAQKKTENTDIYKLGFFLMLFFLILSHIIRSFM